MDIETKEIKSTPSTEKKDGLVQSGTKTPDGVEIERMLHEQNARRADQQRRAGG